MIAAPPVRHLDLADGRTLAHRAYGPAGGAPLLFVPGAASGSLMRFGEELLDGRDLRLLSVDRPGLGSSDADKVKTPASVGDDLRQLAAVAADPDDAAARFAGFSLADPSCGHVRSWCSTPHSASPCCPLRDGRAAGRHRYG